MRKFEQFCPEFMNQQKSTPMKRITYQTHLICKNTMLMIPPVIAKPVETIDLRFINNDVPGSNDSIAYLETHEPILLALTEVRLLSLL